MWTVWFFVCVKSLYFKKGKSLLDSTQTLILELFPPSSELSPRRPILRSRGYGPNFVLVNLRLGGVTNCESPQGLFKNKVLPVPK